MLATSIEFSDESEEDLENLEAVNVRIIQNKSQLELAQGICCYNVDSLVSKSILDMTKLDSILDENDNLDGCDTNQDIPEPEQTQLSATILGSISTINIIKNILTDQLLLIPGHNEIMMFIFYDQLC